MPGSQLRPRPRATVDNLLSIPWHVAWWPAGPKFQGLKLANGAAVTTCPDESGNGRDGATGAFTPTYRSSTAALGGMPTVQSAGVNAERLLATWTSIAQPFEVFAIFALTAYTQGTAQYLYDGNDSTHRMALLTNTTPNPDQWWIYGGAGTISGGTADTNPHASVGHYEGASSALYMDDPLTAIASGSAGTNACTGMIWDVAYNATSPGSAHLGFLGLLPRASTAAEKALFYRVARRRYRTPG